MLHASMFVPRNVPFRLHLLQQPWPQVCHSCGSMPSGSVQTPPSLPMALLIPVHQPLVLVLLPHWQQVQLFPLSVLKWQCCRGQSLLDGWGDEYIGLAQGVSYPVSRSKTASGQ